MAVTELTTASFEDTTGKGVVLVDFWAPWCGPCRMLGPTVEELSNEMANVTFCKVNVDDNREIAQKFNVMSIPTLIIFKDGAAQETSVGVVAKGALKQKIEKYL